MVQPGETAARVTTFMLRAGAGLLFMAHGAQKHLGWFGGVDQAGGTVPLVSQLGLAGLLEAVGGALIVVGLFTRPVALLLFLEMMVAYAQVHAPQGLWPIQNKGELAILFGLIFLYFAAHGAGSISMDAIRQKPSGAEGDEIRREREEMWQRRRRAS